MHFWIDKSRFGGHPCAFNGANRHRPLGGGRSWRSTKPNVVPVHRFTSVESTSSPPQHTLHPHPNLTLSTGNQRPSACSRVINMDDDTDEDNIHIGPVYIHNMTYTGSTGQAQRNNIKIYGILPSLVLAFILIGYTKFYFDTQRGGYEMLTIIGMFGLFAIIWHAVYRHSTSLSSGTHCSAPAAHEPSAHLISAAGPSLDQSTPVSRLPPPIATIPPPPYHIAVLLPSDPKDLPPPSYDLAVGQK